MEDHVNFRVSRVCANIRFFELETLRSLQMVNILKDPCRKIVQTGDFRSYFAKEVIDPAAEKPGSAGYQNTLLAKCFRVNGFLDLSYVFLDDRVHQSWRLTSLVLILVCGFVGVVFV